jgi:lactate dehydrogenase-like 2-hydroxyacid dehydrogenase
MPPTDHPLRPVVLFLTDRGEWHQAQALAAAPADLTVVMRRRPALDELAPLLPTVDYIISERGEAVNAALIAAAPRLKLIVRLGSLLHNIDVAAARQAGVRVAMQPVLGSVYCAEHALWLILGVVKRAGRSLAAALRADHGLPAARTDEDTFAFNWLRYTDIGGLIGKTVAILGMGEIGVELARRVLPFRPRTILYHKRSPYPPEIEHELQIAYAPPEVCARQADVIVSLLPYAAETDRSLNAAFFAQMQPGAMLVHLGSGSVIDEDALIAALRAGTLGGAGLDTYEYEPLQPDHPLIAYARDPNANLLLTPHTAAASLPPGRADDYSEIRRLLHGEALRYEVTLDDKA